MHTLALHRNGEKPTQSSVDKYDKYQMEMAYQRYKAKKKEKPWLETVPQSVPASRAYYDLCKFVGVPVKQKEIKRYPAKPKEKKLPKIPGDHSREFIINGYVVSVRQLAKLLNMRYEVVKSRLRSGVTPEALLEKKGVKL
ncbi:hypothetical protein GLV96_06165 [Staphylococcus agnetis]|uniref:hypothetical protein n=1 Tax=Staphylococcus agnetis TaxID=985762 RepID=UPI00142FAA88|nr:hypothetical protein [Staphylococcus agnetis]NJH86138.1 hypothetical protein [Staphylococcus agnetis]NJI15405.1 hypothetical protein [Staphylococcus agnetis]